MEDLTADQKLTIRKWQTEKDASDQPRRPWASPNNTDVNAFLGAEHERSRSLEAALRAADDRFGARPVIDPLSEKRALKQYSDTARRALVEAERLKEGGNPNRWISDDEVNRKARAMYLEAHRRYG